MVFKMNKSLSCEVCKKREIIASPVIFLVQFIGSKSSSYYSRPKATSTEWACRVTHVTDLSWIHGRHYPVCIHLHALKTPKALQIKNFQSLQTLRRNHQNINIDVFYLNLEMLVAFHLYHCYSKFQLPYCPQGNQADTQTHASPPTDIFIGGIPYVK